MIKFFEVQRLKVSDEDYFKGSLKDYISNSRLALINEAQGGSADIFVKPVQKDEEVRAFRLGSAIHQLFLEPDKFQLSDIELPSNGIVSIFNTIYNLCHKEEAPLTFDEALTFAIKFHNYYNGDPGEKRLASLLEKGMPYYNYLTSGKKTDSEILLPSAEKKLLILILDLLNKDKEISELLRPDELFDKVSYNEDVFVSKVQLNSVVYNAKIKIDNWTLDTTDKVVVLNDLKTSGYNLDNFLGNTGVLKQIFNESFDLAFQFNPGSFQKFHYYRQFAMYRLMLEAYLKEQKLIDDTWTFKQNVIVAQTNYAPRVKMFEVDDFWIEKGTVELEYLFGKMDSIPNLSFEDSYYDIYDF